MGLAAVFVVGEVAHVVQAALDVPVVADHGLQLLRQALVGRHRGQVVIRFDPGVAHLDVVPPACDEDGLLAAVQRGIAVPRGIGEVALTCARRRSACPCPVSTVSHTGQLLKSMASKSAWIIGWLSVTDVIR